MKISFVLPVYNEKDNIGPLHGEIVKVCSAHQIGFEIIVVDDNSIDGTFEELKKLTPCKIIRFRKRFGQTQAINAGIRHASHPLIMTLDGDGQNDPADLPLFIEKMRADNLDVVSGWRTDRKDTIRKRLVSRGANIIRKVLINDGIHDSGCGIKLYKKECFQNTHLYGEMHRFIPALLKLKGFKIGEISVNHRERQYGKSKYAWRRMAKGFIDMLAIWYWKKYALRPLHLLGGIGLVLIVLSIVFGIATTLEFIKGQDLSETIWPMLTLFTFLIGIQVFISGIITDIIVKTYYEKSDDLPYSISQVIDNSLRTEFESSGTKY